ncbi:hypothetical protein POTOM_005620 [Populus tomentosa]|uniref:CCHC-type domain-containing protein n=1 Tax=Populus tomentosa TaxID=118781 RepID=A0A8X8AHM0_POPTO|nr:hypothetical protein POTOM_005620 [Populus tomentosa]
MANTWSENEALYDSKHEEGMITQTEFRNFQRETKQALQAIQATLARLTIGNNLQHEGENYRERIALAREHNPLPRRQLAYEDEYVEHMFRHNRQGQRNIGGREPQTFRMKMDLPSFNDCRQGSITVQMYVEEFHRLSSRNNLSETDAQQVSRFVSGLCLAIQDRVSMQTIYSVTEAINLATKAEAQLERAKSIAGTRSSFDLNRAATDKGKLPAFQPPPINTSKGPHNKCYRCGQPGHRSNQCPRRSTVNLIEPELTAKGVEDDLAYTYEEDEVTGGDEGELLSRSLIVQKLLLALK